MKINIRMKALKENGEALSTAACALIVVLAIGGMTALLFWWNHESEPVIRMSPHEDLQAVIVYHDHGDAQWHRDFAYRDHPLTLVFAGRAIDLFGRSYIGMMHFQTLLALIWMVLVTLLAWRIGGPWAGAIGAVAAAAMPVVLASATTFDDHLTNITAATLAVVCIYFSDGLRRFWMGALVGLIAGRATHDAFVPSNGVMVTLAVGSALAGTVLDSWFGRDDDDPRRLTLRSPRRLTLEATRVALFVAAAAVAFYYVARDNGSLDYMAYIFDGLSDYERTAMGAKSGPGAPLAVPHFLIAYHWGRPLALAALSGAVLLFVTRAKSRYMLVFWTFGLVALVSISAKKNTYYIFPAVVGAAPLVGVAFSSMRGKYRRLVFIALGLALAATSLARSTRAITTEPITWDWEDPYLAYVQNANDVVLRPPVTEVNWAKEDARRFVAALHARRGVRKIYPVAITGVDATWALFRFEVNLLEPNVRFLKPRAALADYERQYVDWVHLRIEAGKFDPTLRGLILSDINAVRGGLGPESDFAKETRSMRSVADEAAGYDLLLRTPNVLLFSPPSAYGPNLTSM
ncbi:MAG: hypothetical protein H6684_03940 [Deltaproteobacteria bacterium]|nr:hypothetical protein [Deltaproteobacteria bacterium]